MPIQTNQLDRTGIVLRIFMTIVVSRHACVSDLDFIKKTLDGDTHKQINLIILLCSSYLIRPKVFSVYD